MPKLPPTFPWVGYFNCTPTSEAGAEGNGEHRGVEAVASPPASSSSYLTTSGLWLLSDTEQNTNKYEFFASLLSHAQVMTYVRLALQSLINVQGPHIIFSTPCRCRWWDRRALWDKKRIYLNFPNESKTWRRTGVADNRWSVKHIYRQENKAKATAKN